MSRRAFLQSLAAIAGSSLLPDSVFAETPLQRTHRLLDSSASIEYVDTPLKDVFADIGDRHGVKLWLLRETYGAGYVLHDQPVTRNLKGITLRSALNLLVDEMELDYRVTDRGEIMVFAADRKHPPERTISRAQAAANERNRQLLEKKIVNLEFVDTPFKDIFAFVADEVGVPFVIDRQVLDAAELEADTPVTINVQTLSLQRALTAFLYPYDLGIVLRDEVFIVTRRDPRAPRRPIPDDLKRAALAPVEIQLLNPSLREAMVECSEQADVTIILDRRVKRIGVTPDKEVVGPLPKMPLRDVLLKTLTPLGLRAAVIDEVLFITPLPERGK